MTEPNPVRLRDLDKPAQDAVLMSVHVRLAIHAEAIKGMFKHPDRMEICIVTNMQGEKGQEIIFGDMDPDMAIDIISRRDTMPQLGGPTAEHPPTPGGGEVGR